MKFVSILVVAIATIATVFSKRRFGDVAACGKAIPQIACFADQKCCLNQDKSVGVCVKKAAKCPTNYSKRR